jgi:hypothetical protein
VQLLYASAHLRGMHVDAAQRAPDLGQRLGAVSRTSMESERIGGGGGFGAGALRAVSAHDREQELPCEGVLVMGSARSERCPPGMA